jgi:ribosomal protein S18 acetylase RimI-like enzyme
MWIGMAADSIRISEDSGVAKLIEPELAQVLDFCSREPVERVFLEDVARRGLGRFVALRDAEGAVTALCHVGANLVPSGDGCGGFASAAARSRSRMIIGEERAVGELWEAASRRMPAPREDRPGQPVFAISEPPSAGDTALRAATADDLEQLLPACATAHEEELGIDPLARDADGFRWRTREQVEEGRSWLWVEDGVILFKAEASAWTPGAVQLQQVWVDPAARRHGYASRGLRDLCRLLLESTPVVTLFVRTDNGPAIALYESIGMARVGSYRSLLL